MGDFSVSFGTVLFIVPVCLLVFGILLVKSGWIWGTGLIVLSIPFGCLCAYVYSIALRERRISRMIENAQKEDGIMIEEDFVQNMTDRAKQLDWNDPNRKFLPVEFQNIPPASAQCGS
jgi:hypothetical protein